MWLSARSRRRGKLAARAKTRVGVENNSRATLGGLNRGRLHEKARRFRVSRDWITSTRVRFGTDWRKEKGALTCGSRVAEREGGGAQRSVRGGKGEARARSAWVLGGPRDCWAACGQAGRDWASAGVLFPPFFLFFSEFLFQRSFEAK